MTMTAWTTVRYHMQGLTQYGSSSHDVHWGTMAEGDTPGGAVDQARLNGSLICDHVDLRMLKVVTTHEVVPIPEQDTRTS